MPNAVPPTPPYMPAGTSPLSNALAQHSPPPSNISFSSVPFPIQGVKVGEGVVEARRKTKMGALPESTASVGLMKGPILNVQPCCKLDFEPVRTYPCYNICLLPSLFSRTITELGQRDNICKASAGYQNGIDPTYNFSFLAVPNCIIQFDTHFCFFTDLFEPWAYEYI